MADNTEKGVFERVQEVTAEVLKIEASTVLPESNFKTDLGADSLDLMTLVVALEEEFDGTLPDEEVTQIGTVEDAIQLIQTEILKSE